MQIVIVNTNEDDSVVTVSSIESFDVSEEDPLNGDVYNSSKEPFPILYSKFNDTRSGNEQTCSKFYYH